MPFQKYQMLKKYSVLLGVIIGLSLILIAAQVYPGGNVSDKNAVGFVWSKNFISNLFQAKAVNGADSSSRIWADAGMIFISLGFASFFIGFSKRIPSKGSANVIKYLGVTAMVCSFLIVTPLHDSMVLLSGTLYLVSIFYITVFVLMSKLHVFKFLCILCMLIFYSTLYIYGIQNFGLLAVMQKVTFFSTIILILLLEYFTKAEDFENIKMRKSKS
jgi:hypothetical protein